MTCLRCGADTAAWCSDPSCGEPFAAVEAAEPDDPTPPDQEDPT